MATQGHTVYCYSSSWPIYESTSEQLNECHTVWLSIVYRQSFCLLLIWASNQVFMFTLRPFLALLLLFPLFFSRSQSAFWLWWIWVSCSVHHHQSIGPRQRLYSRMFVCLCAPQLLPLLLHKQWSVKWLCLPNAAWCRRECFQCTWILPAHSLLQTSHLCPMLSAATLPAAGASSATVALRALLPAMKESACCCCLPKSCSNICDMGTFVNQHLWALSLFCRHTFVQRETATSYN